MESGDSRLREKLTNIFASTGAVVVVAFLVRVGVLSYLSHAAIRTGSSMAEGTPFASETGAIAASIASGRGFSSPLRFFETGPTAWLAPVYPYLLAGIFKVFGIYSSASNLVAHALNCAFSAFTAWPIAAIGAIAFGKRLGRASACLWAILPTSVFYSVFWIWDTALAGLWMALLLLATLKLRGSSRLSAWVGYGALWAAGVMINPALLGVLPFLGLWAIWPQRAVPKQAAKFAAVSALVFVIGLTPWTIRNYAVFHKFIPLRSNFGLELYSGLRIDLPDGERSLIHPNDALAEAQRYARMGEIAYMQDEQQQAIALIRDNPANAALLIVRHIEEMWLDLRDPPYDLWVAGSLSDRLAMLGNALFFGFCFAGVLGALRSKNDAAVPLLLVLLAYPLLFYFTHASLRFRQPIDGIMLVVAVYAAGDLAARAVARTAAHPRPLPAVPRVEIDPQ
jgi:hypothetical protein